MMSNIPIIALLTDYGIQDPFVGILKGVIADISPGSRVIDLTHDIPAGDIKRAALMLWQVLPYYPQGTVFIAVVDPGVGSSRKAIVLETDRAKLVGPDNGIFSYVIPSDYRGWEITNPDYLLKIIQNTFHGRDIFAPAAAHLANGTPPENFGNRINDITTISRPRLEIVNRSILRGEILYADRYGNLLTSLGSFFVQDDHSFRFEPWYQFEAHIDLPLYFSPNLTHLSLPNGKTLPWVKTFSDIPEGKCACLVGGSGFLEIASNRKSAENILHIEAGSTIFLEAKG